MTAPAPSTPAPATGPTADGAPAAAPAGRWPARRTRAALVTVLVVLAVCVGATQIDAGALEVPAVADWWWACVALLGGALSFPTAAAGLLAVSPVTVRARAAVAAQVAGAATKLVAPASVGVMGLNVRLLTTHGASLPVAAATVATNQVAQVVVTLAALPLVVLGTGWSVTIPWHVVSAWWLVPVLVPVLGATLFTPVRSRVSAACRRAVRGLRPLADVLRSPERVLLALMGCAGLTASLTLCLYACVRALGGDIGLAPAAAVLLIGSALGATLPTPGGVGGVEGAMVASFLAVGLPVGVALPAVLAFRLVTFWLPVPAGLAALAWLRRRRFL
ncbi:lysylphosphatidylglycerol synthase transmembrane domain-containing protein [Geodermatophilus ruber]|uniref:Lysylphosphatidylglycerol synthase TM region n=1 Tax=Geodermatophilus ruber TaxID=504800 RepID=A0A1I4IN47_9ACTN|nr:YbhN family protein [Geodermatophilus ruber]SFL55772.1 conserved hypothetical protein [Geodermatophilus ruber]